MIHRPSVTIALSVVLLAGGCKFVPLTPEGAKIQVVSPGEAEACERLGTSKVKVLSRAFFVSRSETKMSEELTTLARNSAVDMKGNAVMAESPIAEGGQTFGIYRCPRP